MKRRVLSLLLAIVMVVGLLPGTVLADSSAPWYEGDTYTSKDSNAELPELSEDLVWTGPVITQDCGYRTHAHEDDCYLTCGGLDFFHWWHSDSCYGDTPTCGYEAHTHISKCNVYTWTVSSTEATSNSQYRSWCPLYWGFEPGTSRDVTEQNLSVTANGVAVKYADEDVTPRASLSDVTATVGNALRGVTVTFEPGYYLESYRFVCGNHDGCGVNDVPHNVYDYEGASYTIRPGETEFDHWSAIGGITANPSGNREYYVPLTKPDADAEDIYAYPDYSNVVYPFYLLVEVGYSEVVYDVTYNYGELAGSTLNGYAVPGPDELLYNESCDVRTVPSDAMAAANAAGYVFEGWSVKGTGYSDETVQPGEQVTCYGSDLVLEAKWTNAPTVSYAYTGTVPTGAPALPETETVTPDTPVTVAEDPAAPTGYVFSGWTSDDVTPAVGASDTTFTMPKNSVVLTGEFVKDESQTKEFVYYIEYYKNDVDGTYHMDAGVTEDIVGEPNGKVTVKAWVNATEVKINDDLINLTDAFGNEYEFVYTNPMSLPETIGNGEKIQIFYNGTADDVWELDKGVRILGSDEEFAASVAGVKTGDLLEYQVTIKWAGNAAWDANGEAVQVHDRSSSAVPHIVLSEADIAKGITAACNELNGEDIISIPRSLFTTENNYSVTFIYTSEVAEADAGQTIVNGVWDKNNTVSDSTTATVLDQYTLTVEYYADNILQTAMTKTDTYAEGYSWSVSAEDTISVGGINYKYESAVPALSGMLDADTTVKLYYAEDSFGGGDDLDKPDDIPDKYQVRAVWVATENGTLSPETRRMVITLEENGQYVTSKTSETFEPGVTAVPNDNPATTQTDYQFAKWTRELVGHHEAAIDNEATFGSVTENNVTGGSIYVYRAYFEHTPQPGVELHKYHNETGSVSVGDYIHYYVSIRNTGNVDIGSTYAPSLVVTDEFSKDITKLEYVDTNSNVTGSIHEHVTYEIEGNKGVITVSKLAVNETITLHFGYKVEEEDAGTAITNKVEVSNEIPGDEEEDNDTEIDVDPYVTYKYEGDVPTGAPTAPAKETVKAGTTYTVEAVPSVEGYVFDGWKKDGQIETSFTMPETNVELVGSFIRRSDLTYTVNYYLENTTTEVAESKTVSGQTFGASVTESAISVAGYAVVGASEQTITIAVSGNVINFYYAPVSGLSYTVNYLEKDTNEVLAAAKTVGDQIFGKTVTETAVDITGYNKIAPTSITITIALDNNVINFYYEKASFNYTVEYYYDDVKDDDATEVLSAKFEAVIDTYENKAGEDYVLEKVENLPLTVSAVESENVIKIYYVKDVVGGEDGGDDIPDKYQKKVTFKVVNGDWNDGTDADRVVYVTLVDADGKWDKNGTAALTAPAVGEQPDNGYKAGSWDTEPPATVSGLDDVTYTYTYARATTPIVPGDTVNYIVEHYKANEDETYPADPTDSEIFGGKIGTTVTAEPKDYEGYCLNPDVSTMSGTLVKIEKNEDIVILKLYYDIDKVGGEDPDEPDDIPDKYQKKVTFKVVNGDWNDGTDADRVVYVTLVDADGKWDKNGTAALTAPAVGEQPDNGYKAGSWDTEPPATVSGTEDAVYTYTYRKRTVNPGGSSSGEYKPSLNKEDHVAYIIGYQDDTVRPQNNITRAEVATIFFRLLTDDSRAYYWSQTNDFSDVKADAWYNNAVSTMANAGVITGYPDGTFRPDAPITRAEFAAIAARFSDVDYAGECSFSDVPASFWGADEIALAEYLGWITGYEDNTFRPNQYITRAEAMTLINRVLERAVEEPHMLPDMVKWIDNLPTAWYYEAVQEATNTHTYTRLRKTVPNQTFCYEDWIEILENPDWAALERTWSEANDQ